jgi:hypothetical protein
MTSSFVLQVGESEFAIECSSFERQGIHNSVEWLLFVAGNGELLFN